MNEIQRSVFKYLLAVLPGLLFLGISLYLSPYCLPENDPNALYRRFVLSVPSILGIIIMGGGMLFIDIITPRDYLDKIEESPIACAIIMAAVCIGVSLIICYS